MLQCVLSLRKRPGDVCTTRLEIGNANRFRFPVLSRTPTPLLLLSLRFLPLPRVGEQTVCLLLRFVSSFLPSLPSFHKPNPTPCLVNGRFALRILRNEWQKPAREQRLLLLHPAAFIATRAREILPICAFRRILTQRESACIVTR